MYIAIIFVCSFVAGGIFWGIVYYSNYKGYKDEYTVTYINVEEVTTKKLRKGKFVDLSTPSSNGRKFLGWYDNKEFSGSPISYYMIYNKDVTLYARWSEDTK